MAFDDVKRCLTSAPTLSFFDPSRPTRLCTDASRRGLGFVLQQQSDDTWVMIQAGSRFLPDAESRYAIKLLAVAWVIMKCRLFLAGLPHCRVITDHHRLVSILNTHRLDEIESPRLQHIRTKIMAYDFTTEWVKGSLNTVPDALSQYPACDPQPLEMLAEREPDDKPGLSIAEIRAVHTGHQESIHLQTLREHAEEDSEYQLLLHYIQEGFPEHRSQLPDGCRKFWGVRNQLSLDDGLIVYGCRLFVPARMRREVLSQLHESHQRSVRTKSRVCLIVYCPGLVNESMILTISASLARTPALPSQGTYSVEAKTNPTISRDCTGLLYSHSSRISFIVDCFSDWPDIIHMLQNLTYSLPSSRPSAAQAPQISFGQTEAPNYFTSP